ncbi:MAG: CoA-binding protein [Spirochaetes bacterium]|nr:CoA-binding protein [Spirochaetota bacterium]
MKHELDYFFHPDGVAVLGASENQRTGGFHILRNVLGGYTGKVYPINPKYSELLGVKCYPDIQSIPESFEALIYFIPARFILDTIKEAAKKGVRAIIIESAGFAEVGSQGQKLQEEAVALANSLGIRLWGPNCMGYLDGHSRNVFSFMYTDKWKTLMQPGDVALIVQSGMLSAGFLMSVLERDAIGISKVCSIGNKCDVNEIDLLDYLSGDSQTGVIGCYLESIVDGKKFLQIVKNTQKPIVVLKSGRSEHGKKAAMSHTASLAGNTLVQAGAFKQAGVVQVIDLYELIDIVKAFSFIKSYRPVHGVALMTFSGGAAIVTTDLMADYGIPLAQIADDTLKSVQKLYPSWMQASHPLDLWPAVEQNGLDTVYRATVEALMNDNNVDAVLVECFASRYYDPAFFKDIGQMMRTYKKPVIVWLVGEREIVENYKTHAERSGIPVFGEIGRCIQVIQALRFHFSKRGKM